ncbi:hypothetical protein [Flagellimonas allohymeniacidonis]|uniref:DUF4345 domain-containing protein n=1 Tax=Flagellimonas allohymeniacidonis TaxID=2517819 RepID=A0A4Q8QB07_9FLAO|nr:hypothetical protein [Allomuricauda hymeniacidonis]TAI47522.1 hypothetical protein EW142_12700 [Allomuricauda hymeniacidonis]
MIGLKIVYVANILVAGWISFTSLFFPKVAVRSIFENSVAYSEIIRLVGSLWGAIFVLSCLGLIYPKRMALVLLFQLIYKGSWLLAVALPAILAKKPFPSGMAVFFLIWCLVLPFVIPWKTIFQ